MIQMAFKALVCFCLLSCVSSHLLKTSDEDIKYVHIIFMNHLDVGYSLYDEPGYLVAVLNRYFTEYFPRAITVALQLVTYGFSENFIYTTHPWLVSMYLDCPPNLILDGIKLQCPSATNISSFEYAVRQGFITWHAGPMNMQNELLDEWMMEFSVRLSMDLDKRFGLTRQHRTVSQRDVPGTTQAVIPILERLGVEAISVGVNSATPPPDVPPVFLWQFQNSSIIGLWHPGGYPNEPGKLPFTPGGMSRKDCAIVTGLPHALCFAFRTDNTGPPMDYTEVLMAYEIARSQFPGALVQASTFENFTGLLQGFRSQLPVVTKEIGDLWIQGIASDPRKLAETRTLFKAMDECMKSGACTLADQRVYNASRLMLKLGEHTWGVDGRFIDNIHWTNEEFYKILQNKSSLFWNTSRSWEAQRNISLIALEALEDHPLGEVIRSRFSELQATLPDLTGFQKVTQIDVPFKCGGFTFQFSNDGYLVQLTDPFQRDWASKKNPLGRFVYQTYDENDFDAFFNATTPYSKSFFLGIGKPNMSKNAKVESKIWETELKALYMKNGGCVVLAMLQVKDPQAQSYYGAPQEVWLNYTIGDDQKLPGMNIEVQWFKKAPTRLPEALFFEFSPVGKPGYRWQLQKTGSIIDPLNVVQNGSQRLHAIDKGLYYTDNTMAGLEILSNDAPLVNLLTSSLYVSTIPLPLAPVNNITGIAINLYNNIWETNWIFWYPYDNMNIGQKFRFGLNFS
ncbi:hypothetical protein CHS0354_042809 [Potamilus streckersoni]|uniref:Glycoside hydrolase family 38 N-terminal domain-containing protein n=1 Tax=Potamilus streckersoni TaxID=2493646 RepID=A0AAE0W6D7_9BIVA|nr:hypothetical protein CHS0354_042809 [Potamilus streckersoni]